MRKIFFLLCCILLVLTTASGNSVRDLTVRAVEYTVASKLKSRMFHVTEMFPVESMVLLKDGRMQHFSFENSPGVWIHHLCNDNLGPGQFDWMSDTREGKPPGKAVIHRNYCQVYELLPPFEGLAKPLRLNSGTYRLSEGRYRNIPCSKITISYPADDNSISTTSLYNFHPNVAYRLNLSDPGAVGEAYCLSPDLYDRHYNTLKESYFARIQLLVDRTPGRPFIYEMKAFNANGKLIYEMNWGEVALLDHVDPKEFELPGNKMVEVGGHQEFAEQNRAYFGELYNKNAKSEPGWITGTLQTAWNGIDNNLGEILVFGGKFTFWLAIAAAVLAVILKIRTKIKNAPTRK